MSDSPFQELVQRLLKVSKQVDKSLSSLQDIAEKIDEKYEPRAEFERWRDSVEGKSWKKERFRIQQGLCAICKYPIQLKGAHIDHKQPISLYPELAIDLKNLQLACPDCNTSKGNRIGHSDENDRFTS